MTGVRIPKRNGRPPKFTVEEHGALMDDFCEHLSQGGKILPWCAEHNMPWSTVWYWLETDKELCQRWRNAQIAGSWLIAEQILVIADDAKEDYAFMMMPDGTQKLVLVKENIARSRLKCDARWKKIACIAPATWGTKLAIGGDESAPITLSLSDAERVHKLQKLLGLAAQRSKTNRLPMLEDDADNGPIG